MKRLIKRGRITFEAGETTPLRMGELAQYFSCSAYTIRDRIRRGYVFELGNETTPAHYRKWLRENPIPRPGPRPKIAADQAKLERELSQLR